MEAIKTPEQGAAPQDCYTNQGTVKVFSKTITVKTNERSELVNLTDELREFVEATGIADGYAQVSSLHTGGGLIKNGGKDALLADVKKMIEQIVPREFYKKHTPPQSPDRDRHNADSHLRN